MSYAALKNQIKSGEFSKAYHFFGEEAYLKNHYMQELCKRLAVEFEEFNAVTFEKEPSAQDIDAAVNTLPVMSDKKLLVLKETGLFKAGGANKEVWKEVFGNQPDYLYIIACEDSFDKRSAAYKAFEGLSVEFTRRTRGDMSAWVTKILSASKKQMDESAKELFLDYAGADMYGVRAHVDKLIAGVGSRANITKEDVENIVKKELGTKEYVYTDALVQKNGDAAAKALSELLQMRHDPVMLLYITASAYISAYKARLMLSDGRSEGEIIKRLRLPMDFLAKKYIGFARKMDAERLKAEIGLIREMDYKIKTGLTAPETGIKLLTAELLAGKGVVI